MPTWYDKNRHCGRQIFREFLFKSRSRNFCTSLSCFGSTQTKLTDHRQSKIANSLELVVEETDAQCVIADGEAIVDDGRVVGADVDADDADGSVIEPGKDLEIPAAGLEEVGGFARLRRFDIVRWRAADRKLVYCVGVNFLLTFAVTYFQMMTILYI